MKMTKRLWLGIIPLILLVAFVGFFSDIVIFISLGWVTSMIAAPINNFLLKYLNSSLSALLSLLSIVIVMATALWIVVPPLLHQTAKLSKIDYETVLKNIEEPLKDWELWLQEKGLMQQNKTNQTANYKNSKQLDNSIAQIIRLDSIEGSESLGEKVPPFAIIINVDQKNDTIASESDEYNSFSSKLRDKIFMFLNPNRIVGFFNSVFNFSTNILITTMSVFFVAFFFLKEKGLFNNMISSLVPDSYEGQTIKAFDETQALLIRYFIGIILQILTVNFIVSIALTLMGIENAILIGFFAGLMNTIPYLGPFLGASFGVMIVISSNIDASFYDTTFPKLIKIVCLFGAVQLIDNFIVQPQIFSKSVKAHPLEIFIIVLMGARIGGVIGMVLAIPLYTIFRVLAKVFLSEFKVIKRLTSDI